MNGFQINICREQLCDNEIPLLEDVMGRLLGIRGSAFHQAFSCPNTLSFETTKPEKSVYKCVSTLQKQGFKVTSEKVTSAKLSTENEDQPVTNVINPDLTYEECAVLFGGPGNKMIPRVAGQRKYISFSVLCAFNLACLYLVYSNILN